MNHAKAFPHVDILILNYNGEKYLDGCLSSLQKTNYPDFSNILIDNNSSDNSLKLVRERFPEVAILANDQNLGFGPAYDSVIRSRCSEFFVLLNNDVRVDPDWLQNLILPIQADQQIAAVSSKLLFMDHPDVINHFGGGMNRIGLGFDEQMFEPDDVNFSTIKKVFFPTGAACLIRKSAYEHVGGFDPAFFMYHEDVDFGWRLHLYGYTVYAVGSSVVYHAFGGTSLNSSGMSFRNNLGYKHALRSLAKNYALKNLIRNVPLLLLLGFQSFWRERSIHFFRCVAWNIRHLPSTLIQRHRIQKSRVRSDVQTADMIWPNLHLPVYFPDYKFETFDGLWLKGRTHSCIRMCAWASEQLGYGWYAPDWHESLQMSYRWSKKKAVFYLWVESEHSKIVIQCIALAQTLGQNRKFSFYLNNSFVQTVEIDSDALEFIELEYSGTPGAVEIKLICDQTWCPDETYHNGDYRRLGLGVIRAEANPADLDKRPYTGISLIIPTYNRSRQLYAVLKALEEQTLHKEQFEVIVVDDGSTDNTQSLVEWFERSTSVQLVYLRQENKKQGAARNYGLTKASKPLAAFIGDDIVPEPDFLSAHLQRHNAENLNEKLVVIGHTKWPPEMLVTPFMDFIHEYGYQFGFSIMNDRNELPFNFFYTSNISVSLSFLQQQDVIFDECFEAYGWEDIELGFRLEKNGMRMCFEHQAIAYHYHPMDVHSFYNRQVNVGRSSRRFLAKHPELQSLLGQDDLARWEKSYILARISAALTQRIDERNIRLPSKIYHFILRSAYALGARDQETGRNQ